MAKGNMLLGMSRGSVGDVTFYRSGGSQRARARNRKPANPMTVRQQTQRAKFANAVKFHKQVTSNFFRFAYEDKKVNESDYNAFMRHNVGNSGFIGAMASKISSWPALGQWEVTSGSLPEIDVTADAANNLFGAALGIDGDLTTVGALSTALIAKGDTWREGDILTVLLYRATAASTLPSVDTETEHTASSSYLQIVINSSDTTALDSLVGNLGGISYFMSVDEVEGFQVSSNDAAWKTAMSNDVLQCAVIHSRNTAGGLLVSTQSMVATKPQVITDALTEGGTYYNAVLADWDAAAEAVLQGGGAAN